MEERSFRRGEIYVADLSPYVGSEQGGIRPVIILQNNLGNIFSPTLIVAPLTSKYKKRNLPTHYLIEDVKTIDKRRITEYVGQASKDDIKNIEKALTISLGFEIPVEIDAP